jgi:hypothetical protein
MLMIFFVEVGITMMTVCFHNHVGNFVAGFMQRQHATLSTVEGEAWAPFMKSQPWDPFMKQWSKLKRIYNLASMGFRGGNYLSFFTCVVLKFKYFNGIIIYIFFCLF